MSGLSVQHVSVRYPSGGGIAAVPLHFEPGRVTALLGPNGSGKSSLIKALVGALPGGTSQVRGLEVAGAFVADPAQRARRIAYLSQTRTGPGLARVRDVIALGRFPFGGVDPDGRVDAVTAELALGALADRRFGRLSGGEQARVLLARALCVDAPVLMVDEPTASLDPYYALRIMETLRAQANAGRTVIVSLHDLGLAERFCDDALVLDQGRVMGHGALSGLLDADILRDVFRVARTAEGLQPLPN